jgi:SAM-dependent methyltransferase
MPDGDERAQDYDDAHGGLLRARAAADALRTLLPAADHLRILDLGVGPATVAAELPGTVLGLDISAAMLRRAAVCLPGRVVRADATAALPIRTASVDVVTAVWWLHMVENSTTPPPHLNPALQKFRAWARAHGVTVPARGKLRREVWDTWRAAHL